MKYRTVLKKDGYGDEKLTVSELVVEPHDNWCGIWTMAPVIKAAVEAVRDNKNGIPGTFFSQPRLLLDARRRGLEDRQGQHEALVSQDYQGDGHHHCRYIPRERGAAESDRRWFS